jgi:hypothetical protein
MHACRAAPASPRTTPVHTCSGPAGQARGGWVCGQSRALTEEAAHRVAAREADRKATMQQAETEADSCAHGSCRSSVYLCLCRRTVLLAATRVSGPRSTCRCGQPPEPSLGSCHTSSANMPISRVAAGVLGATGRAARSAVPATPVLAQRICSAQHNPARPTTTHTGGAP